MKGSGKKEKILASAKKLILEKGFVRTSVEDITNYVGIAKGSFYTYYSSKDELLGSIIKEVLELRREKLENLLKTAKTLDEGIYEYVKIRLLFMESERNLENTLVIVNLQRNIEILSDCVKDLLVELEWLNKEKFMELLRKFTDLSEDKINRYAIFVSGGVRAFRMEKFFYRDKKDFFLTKEHEVIEKVKKIDLEEELRGIAFIINNLVK
ncbi:transcriptional regulator, TetR family [Cetobacterium ceti]|uniref:Transcriptional regulator, TetR family n=1 Tax=Cetobacterium ceti TaxID=180163 RepID=A0A1T4JW56_9FUSO|nr:TetR/AcrR family transcriptional regulator [Cetobacterium ceti]SJZ34393.1 transcriptional regulator, TetR family [Cetobacterium ceti]